MRRCFSAGISILASVAAISAYAGLYYYDSYDNSRFKSDFQRNDDLLNYGSGIACQTLNGDPTPYMGKFLNQTVLTVDTGFQRILWNAYDPAGQAVGIRDISNSLCYPRSIAMASTGEVYVADSGNHRVVKLHAEIGPNGLNLRWLKTFGYVGNGEGEFMNAVNLAIKENPIRVFVSDWSNDRIQEFDADGNYICTIGSYGSAPGQLYAHRGIAVTDDGYIYVADTGNRRIQRYNPNGSFNAVLNCGETLPGNAKLTGVVLGAHQIFILDEENNLIYLCDYSFNHLATYNGNPSSPFHSLRGMAIARAPTGFQGSTSAMIIEKDRLQIFRIRMDIQDFRADPTFFYPPATERNKTYFKYTQTELGLITISVYDSNNQLVRQLMPQQLKGLGRHSVEWDGKDDAGNVCHWSQTLPPCLVT